MATRRARVLMVLTVANTAAVIVAIAAAVLRRGLLPRGTRHGQFNSSAQSAWVR